MSAREMLKREIDYMSDDVVAAIITICGIEKENDEIPNEETRQAYEDCVNGKTLPYTNFADMLKAARELDDEDE